MRFNKENVTNSIRNVKKEIKKLFDMTQEGLLKEVRSQLKGMEIPDYVSREMLIKILIEWILEKEFPSITY